VVVLLTALGVSVPLVGELGVYINAPITGAGANIVFTVGINACLDLTRPTTYKRCIPADPGLRLLDGGPLDFSQQCAARKKKKKSNAGVIAGAVIAVVVVVAAAVGGAVYWQRTRGKGKHGDKKATGLPVHSGGQPGADKALGWTSNPLPAAVAVRA
jgi:hypothetical protein